MSELDRLLDKTKIKAFLCKDAALLGTILARVSFSWNENIPTARISAKMLEWNPNWFLSLTDNDRISVLLHELWHIARLHSLRIGTRDKELWNIACDYRINNDLLADGYRFDNAANGLINPRLDRNKRLSEEEIYDLLKENKFKIPEGYQPDVDTVNPGSVEEQKLLQTVQEAQKYALACGNETRGDLEEILARNLKPKVPWQRLLRQYFMDVIQEDYSWKKPNRRYQTVYLPSINATDESLSLLHYYIDTSGSITSDTLIRFNAELRSIWQDLKPKLLRVINFDTRIQNVQEIPQDMPFDYVRFKGRGGTSLEPVIKHINETKPVASIIFSDMKVSIPKERPKSPVIWIVIGNPKVNPPYGKTVHISEEALANGR